MIEADTPKSAFSAEQTYFSDNAVAVHSIFAHSLWIQNIS